MNTPATTFDLGALLRPELIVPSLQAADRWQSIDELIQVLATTGHILPANREGITAAVRKRESTMSTGIGLGFGLPHASTELVTELTGALGRAPAGIPFEALDGQPVRIVLLLLVPAGQLQKHLHTVAGIARLFRNPELGNAIQAAPDADGILAAVRHASANDAH